MRKMLKAFLVTQFVLVFTAFTYNLANADVDNEAAVSSKVMLKVKKAKLRTMNDMLASETERLAAGKSAQEKVKPFRPTMDENEYRKAKAAANAQASATGVEAPERLAPPVVRGGTNFDGVNSVTAGNWRPPDTHGAVGRNHFVEVTNSHIDMYLRDGTRVRSLSLNSFFGYATQPFFDPRCVYDLTWNRWIITAPAFPESSATVQRHFIAISVTDDPEGSYYIYNFNAIKNSGDFFDYPQLGMDQDSILITANIFGSTVFRGASAISIAKARLYNGLGFVYVRFDGLNATLAPPIVLDQNCSTFFVAAPGGSTISKYTMRDSSRPSCTTLSRATITVTTYALPPDVTQPGTTDKLDAIDNRFQNASTQYSTSLWQIHTINDAGRPGLRWYELNTNTNTVIQTGIIHANGTSNDWNASIAANTAKDVFVTYNSTLATTGTQAQVRFTGRRNADPVNVIAAGSVLATSPTFYNPSADTVERWGDYSAVTLDPRNTTQAWLVNEKINTTAVWGSRIAKIGY